MSSVARRLIIDLDAGQAALLDRKVAAGAYAAEALRAVVDELRLAEAVADEPRPSDAERVVELRASIADYRANPDAEVFTHEGVFAELRAFSEAEGAED